MTQRTSPRAVFGEEGGLNPPPTISPDLCAVSRGERCCALQRRWPLMSLWVKTSNCKMANVVRTRLDTGHATCTQRRGRCLTIRQSVILAIFIGERSRTAR